MSLNIKNETTHELVRRLAELTGQSQTGAVEDAVRRRLAELEHDREAEVARKLAAIEAVVARFQALPVIGPSYEEIMEEMYDEQGLPR
ncbi:type II toxin-antitoxin system VapB family antitoxin [Microbacterium sp. p3-SID336]|uniref:type II toxin-antitoxin system VapB family antitoxin n=1 Tax=Microbacterium sp. p3-SID336 TaxID=2916212 RepID=UPI0021A8F317|nr:type II toxin-antitoxin system VapB family antitoxin [Microbacterium sp. p3-SID336]MCT1476726.1 type II toxin-antitoxin system VapB family antitoxin [Microbacterium sp. p3-SID336]